MPAFESKKFRSAADMASAAMKYRSALQRHPFLLFGLPFVSLIVAGSFVLTPATAIRYEKHDRKVRMLTREQELDVRRNPRKVDWKEEYHVGCFCHLIWSNWLADGFCLQRLRSDKDLENWSQKRVKRLPGEPDGVL
jgi:cytochrome c oxidase assembly protein subunit 16